MITNGFTYVAVLLFMAAILVTLEKKAKGGLKTFFRFIPAVVLCYLVAMLLCTLKVWDLAETKPAYSALKNNLTYAMIFAMLLRCDIRKVLRLGPRMLLGFFSATLTIMIGFIVTFLIMKRFIGSSAWMGLGALCGSWIGGTASAPVLASSYSRIPCSCRYPDGFDGLHSGHTPRHPLRRHHAGAGLTASPGMVMTGKTIKMTFDYRRES